MGLLVKYKDYTIKDLEGMPIKKRNKIFKGENKLSVLLLNIFLRKKKLMILLFIILSNLVNAQIDSTKLDTVRLFIKTLDTTHYWNYYHADSVLLWGYVKEYDPLLIPVGGYAVQGDYVNPNFIMVKGFGVIRWNKEGQMVAVLRWLDNKKKDIKNKFIDPIINLR